MAMTSRQLIAWAALHERRARTGGVLGSALVVTLLAGGALAGWVAWRGTAGVGAASHAWLAGALVAFALAFMRVPFHLYWRADAALLAQLPIEGGPLLDAALWRCVRAAASTTFAVALGAVPLARVPGGSLELACRHVAVAGALGIAAALLLPAVAVWAATLVAASQGDRVAALRVAAGIDATRRTTGTDAATRPPTPSTAALGAFPGFASTLVLVGVLLETAWLTGGTPAAPAPIVLGLIAAVSVLAITLTRATAPRLMGTILRDVSALDRQRLAALEINPPTAIERRIARLLGEGALPYTKDAQLMRRRYPMAFALGALIFLVLAIVGLAQPTDPMPWLTATLVGAAAYGLALAGRLHHPPIELAKLSAMLPISPAAIARAKRAWVLAWWSIFVVVPGVFAVVRQAEPLAGAALLGGGTLLVLGAALARRH